MRAGVGRAPLAAVVLLVSGCPTDPVAAPPDTDVRDTEVVVDTDPPVHTDGPADSDPPTDTDALPACSVASPSGRCPGVATCDEGRCLVDLDPGVPVDPDVVTLWDDIASYIGTRSLLLDTRPIDWTAVSAEGHALVAAATTAFDAAWAMSSTVARLQDGHTELRPPDLCDADPGFAGTGSNVQACVVESDGELVVVQVADGADWRRGDVLLDIDGRSASDLISDRLAQPRCRTSWSTAQGARSKAVSSLMWRGDGERVAHVRRSGGVVALPLRYERGLECAGRVGVAGEQALAGRARTATLPGGVALVVLPEMGLNGVSGFELAPLVDALRAHLAALAPATPIVFDLRGNGGGYDAVASTIGGWLLPTGSTLWSCSERTGDAPDDVRGERPVLAQDDPLQLDGPVAVITDGDVYGTAEFLPWLVQSNGRGVLVGAPSNGAFGMAWPIPFGDVRAVVNALRCTRPDDSVLDGAPPPVDLAVSQTPADAAAGVDTVVEAARVAVLAAATP